MDWNAVATVREHGYTRSRSLLQRLARVQHSDFYNVLLLEVDDVRAFLDGLAARLAEDPDILAYDLARVMPAEETFSFATPEEFEERARAVALHWLPRLGGRAFHVRLHRRGFKGRLSSQDEERFLDHALLEALAARGTPGRITFDDPDAVVAVETVGNWCGMSFWTRDEMRRYPFLGLD